MSWPKEAACRERSGGVSHFQAAHLAKVAHSSFALPTLNTLGALTMAFWVGKCKGNQRK